MIWTKRIIRVYFEAGDNRVPILIAPRDRRVAGKLFPPDVLAALTVESGFPAWKDTLMNRPRAGLAVSLSQIPRELRNSVPSDQLPDLLRSQFSSIGPNVGRSVCRWTHWEPPEPRLNSLWLPAGTLRYPQGLFLVAKADLAKLDLNNRERLTLHVELRDGGQSLWSFHLPCYGVHVRTQGNLAVLSIVGASRDLEGRWLVGPVTTWESVKEKLAAVGLTINAAPGRRPILSKDATAGLWPASIAAEALCVNFGLLPVCLDGKTLQCQPWDQLQEQSAFGQAANLFEDLAPTARLGGLRVAFRKAANGVPTIPEDWEIITVDAAPQRGPYLGCVEAAYADQDSHTTKPHLEQLAGWLLELIEAIPAGRAGRWVPDKAESPLVFDWLWLEFQQNELRITSRPLSPFTLPVEWMHERIEDVSTTTTSTTTGEPCGICRWQWNAESYAWQLLENLCSGNCGCVGPHECPGSGITVTACSLQPRDPATCYPPCDGNCQWRAESDGSWTLVSNNCANVPDCNCYGPQHCPDSAGQTWTGPCTQGPGTPIQGCPPPPPPGCDGYCTYRYNASAGAWELVSNDCTGDSGCYCRGQDLGCNAQHEQLRKVACSLGGEPAPQCPTTTPAPCTGRCKWYWDRPNRKWVIAQKGCNETPLCDCSPPQYCGDSNDDCAYTDCVRQPVRPHPDCWGTTTSTTSTTTTTPESPCSGKCRWRYLLGAWRLYSGGCSTDRNCVCPVPSASGAEECDETETDCYRPSTPSTTDYPPGCSGTCTYEWLNGQWALRDLSWPCSPGCVCPPPERAGDECDLVSIPCNTTTPLPPPTTPSEPNCATGFCLWKYNRYEQVWTQIANYCLSNCPCPQPTGTASDDCELFRTECVGSTTSTTSTSTTSTTTTSTTSTTTTSTTSTTTTSTTPAPCTGTCSWMCIGGVWSLLSSTCSENCQGCSTPEGQCGDGQVDQTGCIQAPTTTRDPNRCYGYCVLYCPCISPFPGYCNPSRWTVLAQECQGDGCACSSPLIGQPCNPYAPDQPIAACIKVTTSTTTTTTTPPPPTSSTTSTTTSTSTSTTTSTSTSTSTTTTSTTTTTTSTTAPPTSTTTTNPPTSQPPTTTTTSTTAPPTSTGNPGCSSCFCVWQWDDEYGWMPYYDCTYEGCSASCICGSPPRSGWYQGELYYVQCR